METRVTEYQAPKAAARRPPTRDTTYVCPYFLETSMAVWSMSTENGMRGLSKSAEAH